MKFSIKFLLIVVFWAALATLGVRNFMRAVESEREYAAMFDNPLQYMFSGASRPPVEYARQQTRLLEWAHATNAETGVMEEVEAAFRRIQQRYGQLEIENSDAVAIVTIPEVMLPERLDYKWRIHVPADERIELVAYVGDGDKSASRFFTATDFTRTLPAGESVIRFVCERGGIVERGSVAPKEIPKWSSRLTVTINEDDFSWQSNFSVVDAGFNGKRYPSQETLFGSEDTVELGESTRTAPRAKEDLYLVVRRTRVAPEE